MSSFSIENLIGIPVDLIVVILALVVVLLIISLIITNAKLTKLQKRYKVFMEGSNGHSLERLLQSKLALIDKLQANDERILKEVQDCLGGMDNTFQKVGLVKYNAFNEMGGKLSFSLALLNRKNDGFILNAMHSREGCFTYMKEIVNGNSITMLADEEKEALEQALQTK